MLRIYARVLAAALVVIAAAAAVGIPNGGLGLSVLYVVSAAVFAYAGFSRPVTAIVRAVRARVPLRREGLGSGAAHAALGGLTMACAVLLPGDDEGSASR